MSKVFLGGTCNDSTWRDRLMPMLKMDYFNPVVDDWDEAAQAKEEEEKENADFQLYVITPLMTGVFSIAEAVECSNKKPDSCVFVILAEDDSKTFTKGQMKSLIATAKLIENNGGSVFSSLEKAAEFLNSKV